MNTETGGLTEVLSTLLEQTNTPLVGVPDGGTARVAGPVIGDSDDRVRVLLAADPDRLDPITATHLKESNVDVRRGPAGSLWVRGRDRLSIVETGVDESVAAVDSSPESNALVERWEGAANVDISSPARSDLVECAHNQMGKTAADVVEKSTAAQVTRGSVGPAGLLVWGGARSKSTWSDVVDVARETDLCSRRSLQRRLSSLCDNDIVRRVPMGRDGSGGRPNRLEVTEHVPRDELLPTVVLDALS